MDLNSLFGNMCNYKETKALCKDIMKDPNKEKFVALFSRKEISVSDFEASDQHKTFDDVYLDELVASTTLIVKRYEESRSSGCKKSQSRGSISLARKIVVDRKVDGKCFNCGSTDHLSR